MTATTEFLNGEISRISGLFAVGIRRIRRRMDTQADTLPETNGNLRPTTETLRKARAIERNTPSIFEQSLSPAIDGSDRSLRRVDSFIADFLDDPELNQGEIREIRDLKELPIKFYKSLESETVDNLNKALTDHIIGGLSVDGLKEAFENALTGIDDRRGTPMIQHINVLTHDAVMEYHARVNVISAVEAGVTNMKYVGTIIRDSREFCIRNAGKTFTLEQIKTLGDFNWRGKKSSNVLIDRGGFRCRHHWQPVVR